MKTFKRLLIELGACESGRLWMGDKTIEEYMATADRGDWVLWLAKKVGVPLKELTLAKGLSAKTVIHLMKDERSRNAVEVAIKYGNGEATDKELKEAAAAAAAAYAAADADADAYAAAAAYAAADAYAAAYADADAYAARNKNRKETADICVKILAQIIIQLVNQMLNK